MMLHNIFKVTYGDAKLVLFGDVHGNSSGWISHLNLQQAFLAVSKDSGHPVKAISLEPDDAKNDVGHILRQHSMSAKMSVEHIYALSRMTILHVFVLSDHVDADTYFIVKGSEDGSGSGSNMMIPYNPDEIAVLNRLAPHDLVWGVYLDSESKTFDVANANEVDDDAFLARNPCIRYRAGERSQVSAEFRNPLEASMVVERHNHAIATAYRLGRADAPR
jgi:hypothetical protein